MVISENMFLSDYLSKNEIGFRFATQMVYITIIFNLMLGNFHFSIAKFLNCNNFVKLKHHLFS